MAVVKCERTVGVDSLLVRGCESDWGDHLTTERRTRRDERRRRDSDTEPVERATGSRWNVMMESSETRRAALTASQPVAQSISSAGGKQIKPTAVRTQFAPREHEDSLSTRRNGQLAPRPRPPRLQRLVAAPRERLFAVPQRNKWSASAGAGADDKRWQVPEGRARRSPASKHSIVYSL